MGTDFKPGKWLLRVLGSAAIPATLLLGGSSRSVASMTVLVGEPFGSFGTMMPVGHTAVYLDRVCADGPLKLKMCEPGEQPGVVIARYHRIADVDWVATPVLEFLYAVERPDDVPSYVTDGTVASMRENYRRKYLRSIVPDGTEHAKATDEWWETAGMAYTRRLWGYQVDTTRAQDQSLVRWMNNRDNTHVYHLNRTNCANFAADVVNFYLPGSVRSDRLNDFGLMSPKQVARSMATYGKVHPEVDLRILEVPQIPGTLRRSRPVRGGGEGLVKTKRYLFTLAVIQPEVPIGLAAIYVLRGRWRIGQNAVRVGPDHFSAETNGVSGTD